MKKNNFWQCVRGLCIILVILIHTLYFADNNFYNMFNIFIRRIINFAVATFIFLAGYFTNIKSLKDFYIRKVVRLLPSLIMWDMVYLMFHVIFNSNIDFNSILKGFIFSSYGNQLYYIYVLVQLFLIAPLLKRYIQITNNKIAKYFPLIISLLYNIFITVLQLNYGINVPLYQYWIFGWFSYYYLGMIIKDMNLNGKVIVFMTIISLIFSICEGLVIYSTKQLYNLSISQLSIFNFFYSIGVILLLYEKGNLDIGNRLLKEFGDYSFGIFLSHVLVLKIVKKIFSLVTLNYYINIIGIYVITLIIVFIINKIYYVYLKERLWKKY